MQFNKNLLNQVQSMANKLQQEMSSEKYEGQAANGKVRVVVTGLQEVVSINIDPELLKEDKTLLEDLLVVALNDALNKSKEAGNNAIAKLLGNMNLGLF
ncbi:MAG: YbaB/EbfC family nucleoid-associated protein [bacterium]|nr:YbaB/EbfC family nucleoid-associated protein [bacterium]